MSSHLDREREQSAMNKALREFSRDFERRHRRKPSKQDLDAARRAWGSCSPIRLPSTWPAVKNSGGRKAPLVPMPEDLDPSSPRGGYHQAELEFLAAVENGDRDRALECVPIMITRVLEAAGFGNPIVEAPGMMKVLCEFTDLINGRNSQLFQKLPLKPGRRRSTKTGAEWMAIVGLLVCAEILAKRDGYGREKALIQVVEDLEKHHLKGEVNHFLTESGHEGAAAPRDRHAALAKRLSRHHREDLLCADPVPREIAGMYRRALASIKSSSVELLKQERIVGGGDTYKLWLVASANLLRDGKPQRAWLLDPKTGLPPPK
jgi:hypothetical protein